MSRHPVGGNDRKDGGAPFPTVLLRHGTALFHGTDCAGDFALPDGPAWFTWNNAAAAGWAGWASPPPGRTRGDRRVLEATSVGEVQLLDTRNVLDWRRLCLELCGDPDAGIYLVAECVAAKGLHGWLGNTELMLVEPTRWLAPRPPSLGEEPSGGRVP